MTDNTMLPHALQPVYAADGTWMPRMWVHALAAADEEEDGCFTVLKMVAASHGYDANYIRQDAPYFLADASHGDILAAVTAPTDVPDDAVLIGRTVDEDGISNWYVRPKVTPPAPAPGAQGVTVPHAALEHDRQGVTALRQQVAELKALVAGRITAPDAVVAKVWECLPKTPLTWEDVDPSSPPIWLYEIMDEALALLPAPAPQVPAQAVPVDASEAVATPAMCVAASDAAMERGITLPASHAAAVIEAALSAAPPAPAPAITDDLAVAKRIAWALVWNGNVRFKTHDELWNRLVDLDLTEQYMRAARAARGEG